MVTPLPTGSTLAYANVTIRFDGASHLLGQSFRWYLLTSLYSFAPIASVSARSNKEKSSVLAPNMTGSSGLIANCKRSKAIAILCRLGGDLSPEDPSLTAEVIQLDAIVQGSQHVRNDLLDIILAGRYSGKLHLRRRAIMGISLY